ncbi:MAG: AMP-binding protein [Thermodesulfobacteriota bacterium]
MTDYRWLRHYDPGVPHTLEPYPPLTMLDVLADSAGQRPGHPMLIYQGREVSCGEMEDHSNALAAALIDWGVRKGDRIALLFLNCPQSFIAFFALWKAGAIAVPLNPLYTPAELERSLNDVAAEVALVGSLWYGTLKSIQPRTRLRRVVTTDLDTYAQTVLKKEAGGLEPGSGDCRWSDLLERHRGSPRPDVAVAADDTAVILFSGGTTGLPKGVMGSHHSLIITGMQVTAWFRGLATPWQDRMLVPLPLFHAFGIYSAFGVGLMDHLTMVLILNPRDVKNVIDTIRDFQVAAMAVSPSMLTAILDHPDLKPDDLKSLRRAASGAAPLMMETKRRFEARISGPITEGYGLTEGTLAMTATPARGVWKQGSVGIPMPDVAVRVVDMETGTEEMAPNMPGEVLIRAPQLMQGYWGRPAETAEAVRGGWLFTGDIGYLDEDGYLFLTSRKKDVIKCGGFQVWPRDVEEVLSTHPAVAEVCVGGIPDAHQVEAVKAWVVLREGWEMTAEELQVFCRRALTGYKVPRHVEFRDSLPKTLVGKVLRRMLQEQEQEKQRAKDSPKSR